MPGDASDVWVFAYGSLMWQPGFDYREARHARIVGYHRAFCIYSVHYRGTRRRPGLVLGLDRGGSCEGIAFRLSPSTATDTLAYLRRRELVYAVYREVSTPIELLGIGGLPAASSPIDAIAFIAERAHPAYAGRLSLARQTELIRGAAGNSGTNLDYVLNTLSHLESLGIREPGLARLSALTGAFAARGTMIDGKRARTCGLTRSWAQRPVKCPHTVADNRFGHRAKMAALRDRC